MRKAFDGEGIQYQYKIIDKPTVQKNIYIKMKRRGLQTKEFTLPVVDVNNEILVHPSPTEVMDVYFFGSNTNE